ncbi:hypothetical protein ABFA07_001296 [Porites harrisoni]
MEEKESLCLEKIAKTYREVERQLNLWKETDCHSTEQIQSLRSPLEQLHSCEKANFNDSPLSNHERLKQKLQFKLLKQTECIMAKLQQDLEMYKSLSMKLSSLWSSTLQVYSLHSSALPMSVVCDGSPTQPSIADLLEWLSDLERIHNELYEEKTDILSKITYTTTMVDVHKAVGDWTSTQGRHAHKIRDIMEQVAVFLASRT